MGTRRWHGQWQPHLALLTLSEVEPGSPVQHMGKLSTGANPKGSHRRVLCQGCPQRLRILPTTVLAVALWDLDGIC